MLVNRYTLLKVGVPANKVANFMTTLSRFSPIEYITIHDTTPVVRGNSTYTTVRCVAHYDLEVCISTIKSRISNPFSRENHKKAWRKLVARLEDIETKLKELDV